MQYKNDEYIIKYNNCDIEYLNNLTNYLDNIKKDIYKFFKINQLSKKLIINICDDLKLFKNRSESSVAFKDDDENNHYIYILSYNKFIKRRGHENNTLDYYFKTLIHEFVHVIHEDIGLYRNCLIWIREGLAIILSKQYENLNYKLDNCNLDDLINNKRTWNINYYSLLDYAFKTYGIEYIKNIIFNPLIQKEETIKIYNQFNNIN